MLSRRPRTSVLRDAVTAVAVAAVVALAAPVGAGASGTVTEYPLLTPAAMPFGIAAGADGGVWFTMPAGVAKQIGRVDPATGAITEFTTAPAAPAPKWLAAGPDGNLWFGDNNTSALGRITPAGVVTVFPAAGLDLQTPRGIATGPNGNLFVVSAGNDKVIEVRPDGTKAESIPIPTAGANAQAIEAGPDGNMWFTEFTDPGKVGRVNLNVTPRTITEFPAGKSLLGIGTGPGGDLWFTEASGTPKVHRIAPDGTGLASSATLAAGTSDPESIARGRDGAMWFTIFNGSQIGRITADLGVQQFAAGITAGSGPRELTEGPDGNMWFTEEMGNRIGRITVDEPPDPPPPTTPDDPPPPPRDVTRPVISGLRLTPKAFAVGTKPTATAAARAKRTPVGTSIRFVLSEQAAVTLTIERAASGRRQGATCRAPSKANRRARACVRYVRAGALHRAGRSGTNTVAFSGRIGKKALARGGYRLSATARDAAGNTSARTAQARFAVTRRR